MLAEKLRKAGANNNYQMDPKLLMRGRGKR
jgi:hypothetical protein